MPTSAQFSTGALNDAVSKAARVAPTKGQGFDKAAGILLDVRGDHCFVMSNNLDVTYRQRIGLIEQVGAPFQWRIPSGLLAKFMSTLPQHDDSVVTFTDRGDSFIRITCSTVKGQFSLLDHRTFPYVSEYGMEDAVEANEFALRAEQVAWAATDGSDQMSGVHITGTHLMASDKYVFCRIPCPVKVAEPVTVQLKTIAPLLRMASHVYMKALEKKLIIQLDPETQVTTRLLEGHWPADTANKILSMDRPCTFEVSRQGFVETLDRVMIVISEKEPTVRFSYEAGTLTDEITLDLHASGGSHMRDTVYTVESNVDENVGMNFNPEYLRSAANASRFDVIKINFPDAEGRKLGRPITITDETSWECLVMPRMKGDSE